MGENVEIKPMSTAEIRQYFNEHAKMTHQLALQLNQLMIGVTVSSSSHRLPQTMQLTGPGMVSFSKAAGTSIHYYCHSPVKLSPHRNRHCHLKIHMYTQRRIAPAIF
jgi:hypothetical protein